MRLKKLFKNIKYKEIKGPKEVEITGICSDSRYVAPGNLFVAKRGGNFDGNDFILDAISAGACAILTDTYNPFINKITQIIVEDVGNIEADIAVAYYDLPSDQLFMIGITGTNGKTTTSYLIKHIMDRANRPSGLIGTIEYITGKNRYDSSLTTPGSLQLQKYLKEMVLDGCKSCVMEVSSHSLAQDRIKNINFNAAIFTNLTQDHLDYHNTLENYADAKKLLFDSLSASSSAIINIDDVWAAKMIENTRGRIVTYGIENSADLNARNIEFTLNGLKFDLHFSNKIEKISSPLIGRFNVYNILAAIALGLEANLSFEEIRSSIVTYKNAPGRLEKVDSQNFHVFVDYAHTPDALQKVLATLKEINKNRIITVFGCGGNRDRGKRPKMGKIASELSDLTIITSDNPRSENPKDIISEIISGIQQKNYLVEEDRYLAIKKAIDLAKKGDIVLIAGKGHETTQSFANKKQLFDDRKIAKELSNLKEKS